jgi:hypothetical protein
MFTFIKKDGREVQVNAESYNEALKQGWKLKEEPKEEKKDEPKKGK